MNKKRQILIALCKVREVGGFINETLRNYQTGSQSFPTRSSYLETVPYVEALVVRKAKVTSNLRY